jgi:hypothetical protein
MSADGRLYVDDFRERWVSDWELMHERVVAAKQASSMPLLLAKRYRRLSAVERPVVDEVLAEALLSDDEWRRFEAMALISEFYIVSAIPSLEFLSERLERATGPGAPYELKKVRRIVAELTSDANR